MSPTADPHVSDGVRTFDYVDPGIFEQRHSYIVCFFDGIKTDDTYSGSFELHDKYDTTRLEGTLDVGSGEFRGTVMMIANKTTESGTFKISNNFLVKTTPL